jgi:hypothetical protein
MNSSARSGWAAFVHQLPKELESDRSNQDVAFVRTNGDASVVVCDGTTSGWDSGWWAWLLAHQVDAGLQAARGDRPAEVLRSAARSARELWANNQREITDPTTRLFASGSARRQPGAATLIALTTRLKTGTVIVSGVAVGDTYVVGLVPQKRKGWTAERAAPSIQSFDTTPRVVFATEPSGDDVVATAETFTWHLRPGAMLLVGTDAIMRWAFQTAASDPLVWTLLANLNAERFLALMTGLRGAHEIDNDDTTLVQLRAPAS